MVEIDTEGPDKVERKQGIYITLIANERYVKQKTRSVYAELDKKHMTERREMSGGKTSYIFG